jgi:ABC-type nitrate/sulfonate/bicarbonate transport system substrate-binding protein
MKRRQFLVGASAVGAMLTTKRARASAEPVHVFVPDADNLQYLSFWVAQASGFFDSNFSVDTFSPPSPQQARAWIDDKKPDVAILPPPLYLQLIADRAPYVLGANLLANDPINLIVRKSVAAEKGITRDIPLRERLEKLRGVKIGIAPHPPPRLRALYSSVGLDADKDATTIVFGGRRQNAAFGSGEVDALYAHTPFLEQAIVHQDAILIVDQSGGEVKELTNRQIHALVFSRSFLANRRDDAVAMVRAIARAQTMIRKSPSDTANALAKAFPQRDRAEVDLLAHLYSSAVPASPIVSVEGLAPAVLFFPEGEDKPSLAGIDLATFVAPDLTRDALKAPALKSSPLLYEILIGAALAAALAWRFRVARVRSPNEAQK